MVIQETARLGNPLSVQEILHANDISPPRNHMHLPCMPKIVKEAYTQLGTCKKM